MPQKKNRPPWWVYATVAGLVLVFVGIAIHRSDDAAPKPQPTPTEIALTRMKLDFEWTTGPGDLFLDVTVTNSGRRAIKDFQIRCDPIAPSGTAIGYNQVRMYEVVLPGEAKPFKAVNLGSVKGQVDTVRCWVADLTIGL